MRGYVELMTRYWVAPKFSEPQPTWIKISEIVSIRENADFRGELKLICIGLTNGEFYYLDITAAELMLYFPTP